MPYLGRQPGVGVRNRYIYTATASQTTFSGADDNGATLAYDDAAYVDVYLNGVLLIPVTDYAATTKTSIVLTSGAAVSDLVEILAYEIASIADTVSKANGGTFDGAVTVNNNFVVDNGTIKLDGNYPVGTGNVALGDTALDSNVSGGSNTAIGADALTANTASNNTAVGYQAAYSNITSDDNTAVGYQALLNNTAAQNTAVGKDALKATTTAGSNTAVGYQAGLSNTTGAQITAIGYEALHSNTTGGYDTALGRRALRFNTTGSYNTALGVEALTSNTTSNNNTAVGYGAGYTNSTGINHTLIGKDAGYSTTGSSNTFVGVDSGYYVSSGGSNTILGRYNGNQGGLDIRTSSNNIVLSDGAGDPLLYYHGGLTSPAWFMRNATTGQWITQFKNESTNPYGLFVHYPNTNPNGTSNYFLYCIDSANVRLQIKSNGDVVNVNNSYGAISDEKLKENIVDSGSQWDDIKALRVRKYSLKADELDAPNKLGVVAQEVEAAGMGGLVVESPDLDKDNNDLGTVTKSVNYSVLYMKAVKALQEAMERIETLEAKVAALENA